MNIAADYEKLLEDTKKKDLLWIEDEIDLLYKVKDGKFSTEDKITANKILDSAIQNVNMVKNENILFFLTKTLEGIEKKYPTLF